MPSFRSHLQNCKKNIKCGMPLLNDDTDAIRKVKKPKTSMNYTTFQNQWQIKGSSGWFSSSRYILGIKLHCNYKVESISALLKSRSILVKIHLSCTFEEMFIFSLVLRLDIITYLIRMQISWNITKRFFLMLIVKFFVNSWDSLEVSTVERIINFLQKKKNKNTKRILFK